MIDIEFCEVYTVKLTWDVFILSPYSLILFHSFVKPITTPPLSVHAGTSSWKKRKGYILGKTFKVRMNEAMFAAVFADETNLFDHGSEYYIPPIERREPAEA